MTATPHNGKEEDRSARSSRRRVSPAGWPRGILPPYDSGATSPPTPSPRQKLVLFTEHRDTLNYLESRIITVLSRKEAGVSIHGGMGRL